MVERKGWRTFNLYRPPTLRHGDPAKATPWREHLQRIYPADARHIELWSAHGVQRPGEKINHAPVLGGAHGIGKDTILEPVKRAVGDWNFADIKPQELLGRFNPFVQSVILRISEARDIGKIDRYAFYEQSKTIIAAPPDVINVDEKHVRRYPVPNVCSVIITTNKRTGGLYLPAEDRRHHVAWSEAQKDEFAPEYWNSLWGWYEAEGFGHVAAYLASLDISGFDPKAPPRHTEAFWLMVSSERTEEEQDMMDLIEQIGKPEAFTLAQLRSKADGALLTFLTDMKMQRAIPHKLAEAGYAPVRCPSRPIDQCARARIGSSWLHSRLVHPLCNRSGG